MDSEDTLRVCDRRGIHESIQLMSDFSYGSDDVIVNLGLRITFIVLISETC